MVSVASPFPRETRTPSFGDARTPSGRNGHLIPRIHSVCDHGDDPRRTRRRAQRRPSQASPSQLTSSPSLRTSRPPPCKILPGRLLKTPEHLVRQSPLSRMAFVCSRLQFCSSLSCNDPICRMAEAASPRTVRSSTFLRQGAAS